jgi:DNA segregation ATPase FtsK/SpoIIIE, S-DNA-T family
VAKARRERRTGTRSALDLEAIGLVVLAAGIFLAGVLLPALPSGELGRTVRAALVGRIGWGAYALPLPPLVLGGLFLLRRSPRWWPRVLLGYMLLAAGAWGLLMLFAPVEAGAWGASLRARLAGAWGALAVVPAAVLITIGLDVLAARPPTHLLRVSLRAVVRALRGAGSWLAETRKRLRTRAAFQADAAQARRALTELDRDLQALSALYPGSGELERWREEVRASQKRLASPTIEAIREARADLRAWQGAVAGFAKDRAAELVAQLEAETALPPDPDADTFETWGVAMKRLLGDAIVQRGRAAEAADRVRKALALDVGGIPIQLPRFDLLDPPAPARDDPGVARELRERVAQDRRDARELQARGARRRQRAGPVGDALRGRAGGGREDQPLREPLRRPGAGDGGGVGAHRGAHPRQERDRPRGPERRPRPHPLPRGGRVGRASSAPRRACRSSSASRSTAT